MALKEVVLVLICFSEFRCNGQQVPDFVNRAPDFTISSTSTDTIITSQIPDIECKKKIQNFKEDLEKCYIHGEMLIPPPLYVQHFFSKNQICCKETDQIMTKMEEFEQCTHSEKIQPFLKDFRDKGDHKKKVFCDRANFLRSLQRCRPKAVDIERKLLEKIKSYGEIAEDEFIEICW